RCRIRSPRWAARNPRAAGGNAASSVVLPAPPGLGADARPRRGATDERDADVAAQPDAVITIECELARVGIAGRGVVDGAIHPRAVPPPREPSQNLQSLDLPSPERRVGVAPILEVAAIVVEWRTHPHPTTTQLLATRLDRDLRRAAFGVPDADRRRCRCAIPHEHPEGEKQH